MTDQESETPIEECPNCGETVLSAYIEDEECPNCAEEA